MSSLSLDEALDHLTSIIKSGPKPKAAAIKPHLDTICRHAERHGLSTSAIRRLVEVVTSSRSIDQTSQTIVIKHLYPAGKITNDLVCMIVNSLGHGRQKPPVSTQHQLLDWLIMVSDILEAPTVLSSLYSVLFNLLDSFSLRPLLCHLLAKLTQRKNVRPFRLRRLQSLAGGVTRDPNLVKLMQIYDEYSPGILDVHDMAGPVVFDHPDPLWIDRLGRIQASGNAALRKPFVASKRFVFARRGGNAHAKSILDEESVDVRDLKTRDDLVNSLEKIKNPQLTVFDLNETIRRMYLAMDSEENSAKHLNELLNPLFEQQLENLSTSQNINRENLEAVLAYTQSIKTLPQPAIKFFQDYLPQWHDEENTDVILALLSYLPILSFEDLYPSLLQPLETALLTTTPTGPLTLLAFYTTLLKNWTIHLLAPRPHHPNNQTTTTNTLTALTDHTALLSLSLLLTTPQPNQTTIFTVLAHLHASLTLTKRPISLPLPPPPPLIIYTLIFAAPSLTTIHQISSLLALYKQVFATAPQPTLPNPTSRPTPHILTLNQTLIDTCNLLLRSRAFNTSDPHAAGCSIPTSLPPTLTTYLTSLSHSSSSPGPTPTDHLSHIFTLSHHPLLANLSNHAFREHEELELEKTGEGEGVRHAGPVTQKSLGALGREGGVRLGWREYRVLVLEWLGGVGVGGVGELGGTAMRGLMGGEKRRG